MYMNHNLGNERKRPKIVSNFLRAVDEEGVQQFKKRFGKIFGVANTDCCPSFKYIITHRERE